MRRRHTRRTDLDLAGATVQRAYRLPEVQIVAVKDAIAAGIPDIHTPTDAVIDALWLWLYEHGHTNGHAPVGGGSAVPTAAEPPPPVEDTDRPYVGSVERPTWSDVDPSALDE